MESRHAILGVLAIAVGNVLMNYLLMRSAQDGVRVLAAWRSPRVLAALVVGTLTVLDLLAVYGMGVPFARMMLLLASSSLMLGVLVGFARGDRLALPEIGLLLTLLCFYVLTWRLRTKGAA